MSTSASLIEHIRADSAALVSLRRDIHAHPELGFQEHRTSELVANTLSSWGIPVHRGLGKTGVVGIIENGTGKRAIGLRADMDALPMTERNTFSHASTSPGKMHACGHDGHTTMLLTAARHLATNRAFDGTVYLIFQPAEEGFGGAREMIKDGLFDRFPMQAIFGIHNWPELEVGKFAVKAGPAFASGNRFRIVVRGKGTHAALPHLGVDPLLAGCQIVQSIQSIVTRNKSPMETALISVTMFHAGEATNVVPDSCEIKGTVRTFTLEVLDMIEQRMRQISESTAGAFGATCEFELDRYYPPTINHAKEAAFVRQVLGDFVGAERVNEFEGTLGSEDFSFFLQEKPGCYFLIGNGNGNGNGNNAGPCLLHSPNYDFNDELIPLGGAMWVKLVEAWFASVDR